MHGCLYLYCCQLIIWLTSLLYCILSSYTHPILILYSSYTHPILILYSSYTHPILILYSSYTRTTLVMHLRRVSSLTLNETDAPLVRPTRGPVSPIKHDRALPAVSNSWGVSRLSSAEPSQSLVSDYNSQHPCLGRALNT